MDQSDTDWGDWPLGDNADIDAMIDAYKADGLSDDIKPDISTPELPVYDDDFNLSGSGESDDSDDDDEEDEVAPPPPPPPPRPIPPKPTPKPIKTETNGTSTPSPRVPNGIGMHRSEYYQAVASQDGMATCEFCGRVGVRHAFYSKSKRFCTLGCSKSYSAAQKDKGKKQQLLQMKAEVQAKQAAAAAAAAANAAKKKALSPNGKLLTRQDSTFDWNEYLSQNHVQAAPVGCFQHCPMADSWDCITVGMKVEVINTDCPVEGEVYWIASVIRLAGYKVLLRYEGFANDSSHDFWINLCTQDVHPVGWCATVKKPLVPPQNIQHKYDDWKDFLVKRLTGARTLPHSFYEKVQESLNEHPIKVNMKVEVVDRTCVSAMRVATVDEIIGGRLRLQYVDNKDKVDEFWCHRESPLVHPVGWSQLVGHKLHATMDYRSSALNKITMKKYESDDTTPDMFPKPKDLPTNGVHFQSGMKLEAIDPLNLASVCTATVMKVFRHSYLMIGIDGSMAENGSDWFCYHASSACIFPCGFCEINDIPLTPPRGYKGEFKWFDYLKQTKSVAAPVKLFDREVNKHGFKVGVKVEAVDLMEPRLICVGTVTKVVGRLLRVHFDGWESSYDQWIDCQSPDIYPVGWCEMVGYPLEGPKPKDSVSPVPPLTPRKRKTKSQIYRGPRKKRKPKVQCKGRVSMMSQGSVDTDDLSQDSNSTTDGSQNLGSSLNSSVFADTPIKLEPTESQDDKSLALKTAGEDSMQVTENGTYGIAVKLEVKDMPVLTPPVVTSPLQHPLVTEADSASAATPKVSISGNNAKSSIMSAATSSTPSISASPSALSTLMAAGNHAASLPVSGAVHSGGPAAQGSLTLTGSQSQQPVVTGASNGPAASLSAITTVLSLPAGGQPTLANVQRTLTTSAVLAPAVSIATTSGTVTKIAVPLSTSRLASLTSTGSVYAITAQGVPTKQQDQQGGVPRPAIGATAGAHIPRVIPGEPDKECGFTTHTKEGAITPDLWGVYDVCQFLRINDCGAYCDSFSKKNICGRKFMTLTKEQIVNLTGMKVGPSLKIYDLIQQLKIAVAQQQQQQQQQTQHRGSSGQQPGLLTTSPVQHQVAAMSSPQVAQHSATLQRMMMSSTPTSQPTALKAQLTQSTGLSLS